MAKDERLYARPVAFDEFPYSNERHFPAFVYLIWQTTESGVVVKAGISRTTRRWRSFLGRGWKLAGLWQTPQWNALEAHLHERLASIGVPAFQAAVDASHLLGASGGHTECFLLDAAQADAHIERIVLEVTNG